MSNKQIRGKQYWRSLNQIADTDEFSSFVEREFPEGTLALSEGVSRRKFLSLMGASLALAGLAGCRRPIEKIIPYVVAPEDIVPGVPLFYASAVPAGLNPVGVLVENHEGRPTKLEGNSLHPSSNGKTNSYIQASILDLYDPDRSKSVLEKGIASDFESFLRAWKSLFAEAKKSNGKNIAILAEETASPSFVRMKKEFLSAFPEATWATYSPVNDESVFRGIEMATGTLAQPKYFFEKAHVIVSLDSDFLLLDGEPIAQSLDYSNGRRVSSEADSMNRMYVAEPGYSITGAMADHRIKLQANQIGAFAAAIAIELKKQGVSIPGIDGIKSAGFSFNKSMLKAITKDLLDSKGNGLIVAGRRQPAAVHALVYAMNQALSNVGETVNYFGFADMQPSDMNSLKMLTDKVNNGLIDALLILGGNPAFNCPADLHFATALEKIKFSAHLSPKVDETSQRCTWHIPESHFLEAWGDVKTATGVNSVVQPQIQPLYSSVSNLEFLASCMTGEVQSGYDIVRKTWATFLSPTNFEKEWRRTLHDGVHFSGSNQMRIKANNQLLTKNLLNHSFAMRTASPTNLEITFSASPSLWDGRFANNGWLQELPDPISKLTWDNAALMSEKTATALGLKNEDMATLRFNGRNMDIPVWIVPGMADYSVGLELGYGGQTAGRIGSDVGANTYSVRTWAHPGYGQGATMVATGLSYALASTQDHNGMDGDTMAEEGVHNRLPIIIREATIDEYKHEPNFAAEVVESPPLVSMWEEKQYTDSPQWGMAIDLNVCTGCMACTIACQSENNVPIVGKEQVKHGREMHWMRMDRYFTGDRDNPESVVQPVACQHCEMAPCEQVCPVAATSHTDDGLNGMTYNRCVGTRYCSNNCPYKVRRFNFYNYTKDLPDIVQLAQNPDVTVRFRGVMEKCTFCVQRITHAKLNAKKNDAPIKDGDVVSACQQTCPTNAIVFGDITDPNSKVSQMKKQNRDYALLGELNTKPRLTYQAKLRNPNPELEN